MRPLPVSSCRPASPGTGVIAGGPVRAVRVRRHPRRVSRACSDNADQHRPRDGRGSARSLSARRPWRLAVACRPTRSPRPPCSGAAAGLEADVPLPRLVRMGRLKVTQTRGKVGTLQQHRDHPADPGSEAHHLTSSPRRTARRSVAWSVRWPTWSPLRRLTDHGRQEGRHRERRCGAQGAPPVPGTGCEDRQDPRGSW